MIKLSAVMIVKNESAVISRCLEAISWVDEIVALDTGSEDNTPQICQSYGAKVFHLTKWQGFGKARQEAVSLASNDWVFSVDADEVVSPQLKQSLLTLCGAGEGKYAYRIKVQSYYLGKKIRFCGWQNEWHLRVFNRQKGTFSNAVVHESVVTNQALGKLAGVLHHYTYPTMEVHHNKMKLYGDLGAKKMYDRGQKSNALKALLRGGFTFVKMYIFKLGFLDGREGFLLCQTTAWGTWYKYRQLAKLCAS